MSRDLPTTMIDFDSGTFDETDEPGSLVRRKKSDLSGGSSMWQARLVLSTLDPKSGLAVELRGSIRKGDIARADELLGSIYAKRNSETSQLKESPGPKKSQVTVLPPEPHWHKLGVG